MSLIPKFQKGSPVKSRRKFEDKSGQHLDLSWVKRRYDFNQPKFINKDGSESTHRLAAETPDKGKSWYVFPTMDYDEKTKKWTEFNKETIDEETGKTITVSDPWKAYDHFKAKNELMPFGKDGDSAIKYSINGLINHDDPKQHLKSKGQKEKFAFKQGGVVLANTKKKIK